MARRDSRGGIEILLLLIFKNLIAWENLLSLNCMGVIIKIMNKWIHNSQVVAMPRRSSSGLHAFDEWLAGPNLNVCDCGCGHICICSVISVSSGRLDEYCRETIEI